MYRYPGRLRKIKRGGGLCMCRPKDALGRDLINDKFTRFLFDVHISECFDFTFFGLVLTSLECQLTVGTPGRKLIDRKAYRPRGFCQHGPQFCPVATETPSKIRSSQRVASGNLML